jgi:hypothetical protein
MIMDPLRYWVSEMGVDGFPFDLDAPLILIRACGALFGRPGELAIGICAAA